jgi:molybdenum cofactor cytidylyltransferase
MNSGTTGLIILAAGASTRLGRPKQNLVYKGRTLLQKAIETATASFCEPVIVVLGSNTEAIQPSLQGYRVTIVKNENWQEGMASSILAGIRQLQTSHPRVQSVILMLTDQPFVDTSLLNLLIMAKGRDGIVAAAYSNTLGAPVLFDKVYFDDLLQLKGADGAKKVMHHYPHAVVEISFPKGSVDIDTEDDYEKLFAG